MKRIGITTMYTNSTNYGGLLQAYALCKVFEGLGYEAEQIRFYSGKKSHAASRREVLQASSLKSIIRLANISMNAKYRAFVKKLFFSKKMEYRKQAFTEFREMIPHSKEIYKPEMINNAARNYDYFVAGSDQIWAPEYYEPAYFLEFVHDKPKFSYAASLAKTELTEEEQKQYKERLRDFIGVSVREASGIHALESVSSTPVQQVLDPTLLLSREQWDEVCAERQVTEDYIFCYYLGDDERARALVEEFAIQRNLKIVTLPYLLGEYRRCDLHFGDIKLYEVSPAQFISLIKYASFVFTDSFHASVFSIIYGRIFYVFQRKGHLNMTTRIISLLDLAGAQESFCDTTEKQSVNYFIQESEKQTPRDDSFLNEMRKSSTQYIVQTLAKAGELEATHEQNKF